MANERGLALPAVRLRLWNAGVISGVDSASMRTVIRGLGAVGALLGGVLAEQIGLLGVMIRSAFGGPFAFVAIRFSPAPGPLSPLERVEE